MVPPLVISICVFPLVAWLVVAHRPLEARRDEARPSASPTRPSVDHLLAADDAARRRAGGGRRAADRPAWAGSSIAQNENYQLLSESNRVQLIPVPPRRGWIIDRNGKPIAINRSSFRVDLIPQQLDDGPRASSPTLAELLELPPDEVDRIKRELTQSRGFQPVSVADNIPYDNMPRSPSACPNCPASRRRAAFTRFYPGGPAVGHLVGYVGAAIAEEYEKEDKNPLLLIPGFKIGKEGLEKTLEPTLARHARRAARRGHRARQAGQGARPQARPQRQHRPADDRRRPARICGAADRRPVRRRSSSSTSPTATCSRCLDALLRSQQLLATGSARPNGRCCPGDDHLPLVNKVARGPLSVGLDDQAGDGAGASEAGRRPQAAGQLHRRLSSSAIATSTATRVHGPIDMDAAIVAQLRHLFLRYVPPGRRRQARADGPLAGLRREIRPAVRQPALRHHARPRLDDAQISPRVAGLRHDQHVDRPGHVLINPLQLAVMASRLATGKRVVPRLLKSKPVVPQTQLAVDRGASELHPQGDGRRRRSRHRGRAKLPLDGIQMAGKTGTAQIHNLSAGERGNYTAANWKLRDHALFIAFAPFDKPRYAAAAIIEHGGFGAAAAAPLVRDMMTYLFDKHKAIDRAAAASSRASAARSTSGIARKTAAWRAANGLPPLPANAGMITSAIIPQPLARLPWRLIFLVVGDRRVRPDRPLFGGGRIGAAVGGQAGDRLPRSSSASPSPCRGSANRRSRRSPSRSMALTLVHADRRRGARLRQQGRAALARPRPDPPPAVASS